MLIGDRLSRIAVKIGERGEFIQCGLLRTGTSVGRACSTALKQWPTVFSSFFKTASKAVPGLPRVSSESTVNRTNATSYELQDTDIYVER